MNTEFFEALDLLEKQKGIPKEYMLERVEAALISAFKRDQGGNANVRVVLDPVKKDVRMFRQYDIVETVEDPETQISVEDAKKMNRHYKLGGIAEEELKMKNFRRLSAQTAKQVIIQGIREAERGMMIKEYEDKKEEIITATVLRTDEATGNVTVDTGTSIATLLKSEQIPGDRFNDNDRIKVFVTEVRKESRGPLVTLSRTHPGLVRRLFELEIPEIQDGTVADDRRGLLEHGYLRRALRAGRRPVRASSRSSLSSRPCEDPRKRCTRSRRTRYPPGRRGSTVPRRNPIPWVRC